MKSYNVQKDSTTLQILYESGFLQQNPCYQEDQSFTFWQAFRDALENTNRGPNVKDKFFQLLLQNLTIKNLDQN
jgi:hypothetical protein